MRVTEGRLIELQTAGIAKARTDVARAGQKIASGRALEVPSDDPVAWIEGARVRARQEMSQRRGSAIGRAETRLVETEGALTVIDDALIRAQEIAVQMATPTVTAAERAQAAVEVRALLDTAVAAANTRGHDGEYLLAGDQGLTAPFSAVGVYSGDSGTRLIEAGEGVRHAVTVSGARLTAASGIDVLPALDALATALAGNVMAGIEAALDAMNAAVGQVADARSEAGYRIHALRDSEDARVAFENRLAETQALTSGTDMIEAASELARASNALEAARLSAERIIELARPR